MCGWYPLSFVVVRLLGVTLSWLKNVWSRSEVFPSRSYSLLLFLVQICSVSCLCFSVWLSSCSPGEEAVYGSAWITPLLPWCKQKMPPKYWKRGAVTACRVWLHEKQRRDLSAPCLDLCGSVKTFWFEKHRGQFREQHATVCNSICPQLP